jgi:hypothetical protein
VSGISYLKDSDQLGVSLKVLDNAQGEAGIYAQKLDASGNRLWGDTGYELLPLSSDNYHEPFGLQLTDNSWMVAYTEGGLTAQDFKVVKFDLNGNLIWNKTISAVSSNKYDATMGTFMNDQLVVVWEDERTGSGVYAQNISGEGTLGVIATIIVCSPDPFAKVYPTLTHEYLFVDLKEAKNGRLNIYDIKGTMQMSLELDNQLNEVDLSELAHGQYLYSLIVNGIAQNGKFCKQ